MQIAMIMLISFLITCLIGVPIFIVVLFSAFTALVSWGAIPLEVIPQRVFTGIDSFTLIAIPFFIMTGLVMERGGLALRLLDFCAIFVGRIRGGLAAINVIASMFFGGITGAASAEAASIGSIMIPGMARRGYDKDFAVALTITSSVIGIIIPPSIPMMVYAVLTDQSVAALFISGVIPGIIIGLGLILVSCIISVRREYPREEKKNLRDSFFAFLTGLPALATIGIIFGGIFLGVFTPTEAAIVAAVYTIALSCVFYHSLNLKDLLRIFADTGATTSIVLLLIGCSNIFSWILATQQIPILLRDYMIGITNDKDMILLMIIGIYLIIGCFIDITPAMVILIPIFLPLLNQLNIDLVHFGIVTVIALGLGLYTPPVGACLAVGVAISNEPVSKITIQMIPFFFIMVAVLLLVTYIPSISLFLVSFVR